jgi:hypothetical protein
MPRNFSAYSAYSPRLIVVLVSAILTFRLVLGKSIYYRLIGGSPTLYFEMEKLWAELTVCIAAKKAIITGFFSSFVV